MSSLDRVISGAAVAALLLAGAPILGGQEPTSGENGRPLALSASGSSLASALDRVGSMLRAGELDFAAMREDTMIGGRAIERLVQIYDGLPVFGGQVVRQLDGRSVVSVSGRVYEAIDTGTAPSISSQRAGELALAASAAGGEIHGETVLGILPFDSAYRLVYRLDVRTAWTIRTLFVDAQTGEIVRSTNGIHSQAAIGQGNGVVGTLRKMSTNRTSSAYQAVDILRPARTFTLTFDGSLTRLNFFILTSALFNSDVATDSDNVWTDGPTVDAHVFQGQVYDYYFRRFGRRGMDDRNIEVDGVVHPLARSEAVGLPSDLVNQFINNAFYCCSGILVYGDGDGRLYNYFAGALDVVAHEWTHGVIDFSSQLIYRDESGALNEAFSDIMGASAEFFHQPVGGGRDRADWQIAEDAVLAAPGYLRSLNNPSAIGFPDHYSLRRFVGTATDDGGVHFNLTIATHAFYLAVAGGRNGVSGITVPGVGLANIERMERIFYRAFTMLLTPSATFSDARRATLQAAIDLYGSGSNDYAQVELAWTAVGVH